MARKRMPLIIQGSFGNLIFIECQKCSLHCLPYFMASGSNRFFRVMLRIAKRHIFCIIQRPLTYFGDAVTCSLVAYISKYPTDCQ